MRANVRVNARVSMRGCDNEDGYGVTVSMNARESVNVGMNMRATVNARVRVSMRVGVTGWGDDEYLGVYACVTARMGLGGR